jgi:hypothetical protein
VVRNRPSPFTLAIPSGKTRFCNFSFPLTSLGSPCRSQFRR